MDNILNNQNNNRIGFENTKRIMSLFQIKAGSTFGIKNSSWGKGDELRLEVRTKHARKMDVLVFCGAMEYIIILIPLSTYNSLNDGYMGLCNDIYDGTILNTRQIELIGYNCVACLGTGLYINDTTKKADVEKVIEEIAEAAAYFKGILREYGYDTTSRLA